MTQLKVKGELLADGIEQWFKKDLTEGLSASTDLGKFFFSVASASIGFVLTLIKLNDVAPRRLLLISALFYIISIIGSLVIVMPRKIKAGESTNLFDEYRKQYRKTCFGIMWWFLSWMTGTVIVVCSFINT